MAQRLSGLLDAIPGYRGYRAKEDRRDADRRVRDHVAARFADGADRVDAVGRALADQRRIREIGPVEEFGRSIRHLVDRIQTASYGYGGLFGDRDVNEAALDQLRLFDDGLVQGVDQLAPSISALESALAGGGDVGAAAREGAAATRTILARLDLRAEVIETGKPAPEEKVAELLKPPPSKEEQSPPPAFNLHDGDAVAILGENALVDARIDLAAAGNALRLFRLRAAPEVWLAVPGARGQSFARVAPVEATFEPGPQSTIAGTAYTLNWSGAGDGDLIGAGGASGRRAVTVSVYSGASEPSKRAIVVDWGGERQVFTGSEVHPDDVEIYGATNAGR